MDMYFHVFSIHILGYLLLFYLCQHIRLGPCSLPWDVDTSKEDGRTFSDEEVPISDRTKDYHIYSNRNTLVDDYDT